MGLARASNISGVMGLIIRREILTRQEYLTCWSDEWELLRPVDWLPFNEGWGAPAPPEYLPFFLQVISTRSRPKPDIDNLPGGG